jgi:uncharacterized protein YjbI with pentapeptide repeats
MKNAFFSDVKFQGTSDFSSVNFSKEANFFGSQFGATSFGNCNFSGPARFGPDQVLRPILLRRRFILRGGQLQPGTIQRRCLLL